MKGPTGTWIRVHSVEHKVEFVHLTGNARVYRYQDGHWRIKLREKVETFGPFSDASSAKKVAVGLMMIGAYRKKGGNHEHRNNHA